MNTTKIKTSELIGPTLAWAAGVAEGHELSLYGVALSIRARIPGLGVHAPWRPDQYWNQGGPIIEREEICTKRQAPASVGYEWNAWIWTKHIAKGGSSAGGSGPTPLIAAMRCYVASKLGDEVEVPDELL